MNPPDDAIETTGSIIWMDSRIIHGRARGGLGTADTTNEALSLFRELTGGIPAPLLFDARKWPGGDIGAWATAATYLESSLTAYAILVEPESSVATGPYSLDRLPIPFRVFTDAAEALAFLRGFQPDE